MKSLLKGFFFYSNLAQKKVIIFRAKEKKFS
ncbi:hypothetical protein FPSM_00577 [Flavobacterium psychrophilum]|nr:hypothetical protein FPSM_00577 [Flavobacterium psychrophilum]